MRPRSLKIPGRLAYTAFRVAVAGTLACSSDQTSAVDASTDRGADVVDAQRAEASPTDGAPADATGDAVAPGDATADGSGDGAIDSPADALSDAACTIFCGAAVEDASCPGTICDVSECHLDAGCEPFA